MQALKPGDRVTTEAAAAPSTMAGRLLWGAIAATLVLSAVGTILTPTLSVSHPLLMLWIEAADRNLLLARHVSLVPYLVAGTVRRLVGDPLFFLAGRWYGQSAVDRLERPKASRVGRSIARGFRRARYPLLVAFTGRTTSLLAGASRMPVLAFATIAAVRTFVVVVLFRWVSSLLGVQIDGVLRAFQRYTAPATVLVAAVVLVPIVSSARSARGPTEPGGADGR